MASIHGRLRRSLGTSESGDDDPVSNLELFFELVYAFAFTQVTALMLHESAPGSLIDGVVVLSLLWWSWSAFSWLANQARTEEGVLQGAVIVAMVAVFIACLALPDAFHHVRGALYSGTVLVGCYAAVRLTHFAAYLLAARGDRRVRRQVLLTVPASMTPTIALLVLGAALDPPWQRPVWAAAVLYDFAAVFATGRAELGWVIRSATHFAEGYGLIVLLALGESVVSIANGLDESRLSWKITLGAMLALLVALGMFLAYFQSLFARLERALSRLEGRARAELGRDAFTYLHFPVIVGIILAALGTETALGHLGNRHLGALGGWSLGGGVAVFLTSTAALERRACGAWLRARLAASALLVAISALLALAPPLPAIGATAAVVIGLAAVERNPAARGDTAAA